MVDEVAANDTGANAPESRLRDHTHRNIGLFLLVLPFLLFLVLIAIWPVQVSPDALSLEQAVKAQSVAEAKIAVADELMRTDPGNTQAPKDKAQAELERTNAENQVAAATTRLKQTGSSAVTVSRWQWLDRALGPSAEIRLLLLVMISAAIGSSIQAAKSFAAYTGRGEYDSNWDWWYFLRFPTGIGIALLMYCVVRGGFMPGSLADQSVASTVNPFGVAGLSALAGMFSREASDKLAEIFGTLFRTGDDGSPVPVIDSVPDVVEGASDKKLELEVKGKNFKQGLTVLVDGVERKTVSIAETKLVVQLDKADVAKPGPKTLRVTNNPGGKFAEKKFKVIPPASGHASAPTLAGVKGSLPTGAEDVTATLTVTGTGFAAGVKLVVGGKPFEMKPLSTDTFEASVPRADIGGGAKAKVKNPDGTESKEIGVELT